MLKIFWKYRFVGYNALFALFYLLLTPLIFSESVLVFKADQPSGWVAFLLLLMLLVEHLGLWLKVPGYQQTFRGEGVASLVEQPSHRLGRIFMRILLFFAGLGLIVLECFWFLYGAKALGISYGGTSQENNPWFLLVVLCMLVHLIVVLWRHFQQGTAVRPKQQVRLSNPPQSFLQRELLADFCLLLYSALAFSLFTYGMVQNTDESLDSFSKLLLMLPIFFVFYVIFYTTPNMAHFLIHTKQIEMESRAERLRYWIVWGLTFLLVFVSVYFW